jgi:predicted ester cyclase
MRVSLEDNKDLIRRYIQAIDQNETSDWSVLDEFIAEDFVAHNPLHPGVSLDREGMKQGAELFRVAAPGARHTIGMQVAEGDLVVSHIMGRGMHRRTARHPRHEQGTRNRRHRGPSRPGREDRRILVGDRRRACLAAARRTARPARVRIRT